MLPHQSRNCEPSSSLYPQVLQSDLPGASSSPPLPTSSSLYPPIDPNDLLFGNLFPDFLSSDAGVPSAPPQSLEETLLIIPGAILHLIDSHYSVQLASGDFSLVCLRQGDSVVAVLARVSDEVQWPLTKDEVSVKLDHSRYFFSLCAFNNDKGINEDMLNYGLSFASKGQDALLYQLDEILDHYSSFSVQNVLQNGGILDPGISNEISPADFGSNEKREMMEETCAAYWTTLAPNVEDYSGIAAKLIATGSGQLIKGILWCGDVTIDRLKWGNEVMKTRITSREKTQVSPQTLKRIERVKNMTKMTNKVANGILSGVVKVSGFFSSSVVNSKAGKKFFKMLPGEIVLASLDGFGKVCDAVEVAGKNVMSTSSTVTTGLVNHRYGEDAARATNEGLNAAGHAAGAAWAVFKIRRAINPKGVLKTSTLVKSAAKTEARAAKKK